MTTPNIPVDLGAATTRNESRNCLRGAAMTYDPNNLFAKVLRGEIPAHKIYEDDDTLAFLDIMPRAEGHALVITKEKATNLFDVSPEGLAKLLAVVQKIAPKISEAVAADGVLIAQYNGAAAGQTVFHLHVHIIPRKAGTELKPHSGKMEDQNQLMATADKIRAKLKT
jgi:histidine triad (HIT) family protein